MHKLESVLSNLRSCYGEDVKLRELAGVIRFNTDSLNDSQLIHLSIISVQLSCDVSVKRSGTGLLVIITL